MHFFDQGGKNRFPVPKDERFFKPGVDAGTTLFTWLEEHKEKKLSATASSKSHTSDTHPIQRAVGSTSERKNAPWHLQYKSVD